MKNVLRRGVLVGGMVLLSGCAVFSVERQDIEGLTSGARLSGIPFYTKVGRVEQTTVSQRTYIQVDLVIDEVNANNQPVGKPRTVTVRVTNASVLAGNLQNARRDAQDAAQNKHTIDRIVSDFVAGGNLTVISVAEILQDADLAIDPQNLTRLQRALVSDTYVRVAVVDYDHPYTLNVKAPPFSQAEGTIELANDGTLTKATGKVDTTKLADVIPLKELITAAAGGLVAAAAGPQGNDPQRTVVDVQSQSAGFTYTFKRLHLFMPDPAGMTTVTFASSEYAVRSPLGAQRSGSGGSTNKKEVQVKGTITLP